MAPSSSYFCTRSKLSTGSQKLPLVLSSKLCDENFNPVPARTTEAQRRSLCKPDRRHDRHSLGPFDSLIMFSFTGLFGSLIHPFAMLLIAISFMATAILGIRVRRSRLYPSAEITPLLHQAARKRYHHKLSAFLLFATVFFMSLGMANTFLRTGRLFPGPHLYGGFLVIILLSVNAAMVPWFKDIVNIRSFHALVGGAILISVLSQVWSGLPLLSSVINTVPL